MTSDPGRARRPAACTPSLAGFAALNWAKEGVHAAASSKGILIVAEGKE